MWRRYSNSESDIFDYFENMKANVLTERLGRYKFYAAMEYFLQKERMLHEVVEIL